VECHKAPIGGDGWPSRYAVPLRAVRGDGYTGGGTGDGRAHTFARLRAAVPVYLEVEAVVELADVLDEHDRAAAQGSFHPGLGPDGGRAISGFGERISGWWGESVRQAGRVSAGRLHAASEEQDRQEQHGNGGRTESKTIPWGNGQKPVEEHSLPRRQRDLPPPRSTGP
jgi:hypothetical protein